MTSSDLRESDAGAVLGATLQLANTQLLAQSQDEVGVDGQAMGLVGFGGAVLGVSLAAISVLGAVWLVPMVAAVSSTGLCLALQVGARGDVGPAASRFCSLYGRGPGVPGCEQLLSELDRSIHANARRIRLKRQGVRLARGILLVGLLFTGLVLAADPLIRIAA